MPTQNTPLLTIKEAANFLKVSEKTLRRWEESGKLLSIRTSGGHRRYSIEFLKEFKKNKNKLSHPNSHIPLLTSSVTLFGTPELTIKETSKLNTLFPTVKNTFSDKVGQTKDNNEALIRSITPVFKFYKKFILISVLSLFILFGIITALTSTTFQNTSKDIFSKAAAVLGKKIPSKNEFGDIKKQLQDSNDETEKVLAATSFSSVSVNLNVDTFFKANADIAGTLNLSGNSLTASDDLVIDPGGGGVTIGADAPQTISLDSGALFVSGDVESGADIYAVNANFAQNLDVGGIATLGSLTLNAENFTDLTGGGLTNSGGVLTTTLGTSIDSSEITDDTLTEVDLKASNSPTNAYVLTYNSSTGGFTWAVDAT